MKQWDCGEYAFMGPCIYLSSFLGESWWQNGNDFLTLPWSLSYAVTVMIIQ